MNELNNVKSYLETDILSTQPNKTETTNTGLRGPDSIDQTPVKLTENSIKGGEAVKTIKEAFKVENVEIGLKMFVIGLGSMIAVPLSLSVGGFFGIVFAFMAPATTKLSMKEGAIMGGGGRNRFRCKHLIWSFNHCK